jgi:hypothetical protein
MDFVIKWFTDDQQYDMENSSACLMVWALEPAVCNMYTFCAPALAPERSAQRVEKLTLLDGSNFEATCSLRLGSLSCDPACLENKALIPECLPRLSQLIWSL